VSTAAGSNPTSPSQSSPNEATESTPRSTLASPDSPPSKSGNSDKGKSKTYEKPERNEEGAESLSDMMCSLVTNNCGETRYIGMYFAHCFGRAADCAQDLLLDFQFSRPKVYSGLIARLATRLSKT
jgi:hypothetical protein